MKSLLAMLPLFSFLSGCSDSQPLSPKEFSDAFANRLRVKDPSLEVEIKVPLQLQVASAEKKEHNVFLDNAYSEYKLDPSKEDEGLEKYVTAALETVQTKDAPIDPAKIVPIIKDSGYLDEAKRALAARGFDTSKFNQYYEQYNDQLIIMYGVDSAKNIKYLLPADLKRLKLDPAALRALAVTNLKGLLPKIERHGSDGTYMLTAGGTYEASMLLFDSMWNSEQMPVRGEIVAAVPSRDMLLITGSKDAKGLNTVREVVAKTMQGGSYTLTSQLFVYRNGKFVAFSD
jgi:uncharacterized protein YtpQ (UPF0354 family)